MPTSEVAQDTTGFRVSTHTLAHAGMAGCVPDCYRNLTGSDPGANKTITINKSQAPSSHLTCSPLHSTFTVADDNYLRPLFQKSHSTSKKLNRLASCSVDSRPVMSFRANGNAILVFIMQKDHADRKFLARTMQIVNSLLIMQKSASYLHAASTISMLHPAVSNSFRSS